MMEDLSLHILDIAENAIAAGATRITVTVNENEKYNLLSLRVADNGRGMSAEARGRALDPFFSTKGKRTGLGLPLLAQTAEQCGGCLTLVSAPRKGTTVTARFRFRHIDRPPLTRMTSTLTTLILGHPDIDIRYCHRRNSRIFRFASRDFIRAGAASAGLNPELIAVVKKKLLAGLKRIGRT
jgi:hypothetical protein